jgi:hypothetical protein
MHHEDISRGHCLPPNPGDRKTETAVLALLIAEHPTRLSIEELVLVLHADPDHGDPEGGAEQAVRELTGAGLLHREGRFLTPSRAALYFSRLESD